MKKLVSWILIVMLSGLLHVQTVSANDTSDIWDGSVDTSWYSSAGGNFTINNAAEFVGFAQIVAGKADGINKDQFSGKTVTLATDLDFDGLSINPVGVATSAFKGTFDGNGHIITNAVVKPWADDENAETGVFARLQGGTIKNFGVSDVMVSHYTTSTANCFVGGVVGHAREGAKIESCFARNITLVDFTKNDAVFGGIVGQIRAGATVENCYTTNIVTDDSVSASNAIVSSLVGKITSHSGTTKISNCYAGVYNDNSGVPEIIGAVGNENASAEITNVYYNTKQSTSSWTSKTAGEEVATDTLKALGVDLGAAFVANDDESVNSGYPVLIWETGGGTEIPKDETVFRAESKTENSAELTYYEGALYSMNQVDWYENNVFGDLTTGIYKFYMKKSEDSLTVYEATVGIGDRLDDFDTWDGTSDITWYDEDATVYYISTAEQFAGLSELTRSGSVSNFTGKTINLTSNLDMSNLELKPVGYGNNNFAGIFDGNGHVIKNVVITDTSSDREIALFGRVDGTIKNVGVDTISLNGTGEAGKSYQVGGLVGYGRYATITNCFVRNVNAKSLENTVSYLGGFIGYARGCTITNCYVTNFTISDTDVVAERMANFSANTIETSKLTGCYAGVNNGNFGYDLYGFTQASSQVTVTNCFYDAAGNGNGSGTAVETEDLIESEELTAYFTDAGGSDYNIGYPVQLWETYKDVTYKEMTMFTEGDSTYLRITGLKNNTEDTINPVASCILYEEGYMTDADFEVVSEIDGYGLYTEDILLSVDTTDVTDDTEAKGMLYVSCEKGIPLSKSVTLELN